MSTPLRVMIVMPLAEQRGGAEKMLQHLLEHAPKEQVIWSVVFLKDGPMAQWVADREMPVTVVDAGRLRNPLQYIRSVRQLAQGIRAWQPHVVFSWMTKAHLYAGVAAKIAGVPAAWFHHSISSGAWEERLITLIPAVWVAVPSEVAARAQARLPGCPTCHVVYPGIDIAEFTRERLPLPQTVRQEFGIPADRTILGTVARLQHWKGIHVFLQSVALVAQTNPDIHAMVVGGTHFSEPEYPGQLQHLAESLGIAGRVTFTGQRQDVARLMNAFDIFVHSSTHPEPGGMTVMEAMALGKPVIATRAGGPTETVLEGETGLLVASNDAEAMAEALQRLVNDPRLGQRFEHSAIQRARLCFSAEVMSREIVSLLQKARMA